MRHRRQGKVLDRRVGPRRALLRNLATSLVLYEKIRTTEAKAKAIKPIVERLISVSRGGNLTARRRLLSFFGQNELPVKKMMEVFSPRFAKRPGGFTRIRKIGPRSGDGARIVQIEILNQ